MSVRQGRINYSNMHLFKSSKYSPTKAATKTTVGGGNDGEGWLSSSGNGGEPGASTSARMKHKSMDMSFCPFSNFLTRSISRKVASSPERVPCRNEFDTPGFLSRSWSINKKLDRSLSWGKSAAKGGNGNVWEVDAETKPSHRRSQSTTRKNDWFGSFVGCRWDDGSSRGKSGGEGSGSSRSKSTATRRSYDDDGGSGSSRGGRPEMDGEEGSSSRSRSESMSGPLPRGGSRRSSIPILFSNSKGKPPPVERTLECSLEELLSGCVKEVLTTRNVFGDGISHEQETLRIKVKPGWQQGTKITFEGMGDEQPGMLPAGVIFSIAETRHKLYRREGDDLVMAIEIPLVKALSGCNLSIPLLGGGSAGVRINEVIHPGYERVLIGQGMHSATDKGVRGNLCLRFHVAFPKRLSRQQRSELYSLLRDS